MYHITLMRHGESQGNALGLIQGQSEMPLTERGAALAQELAQCWKEQAIQFSEIIASPIGRARQTAEYFAAALQAPLRLDENWMERNFGALEGRQFMEIRASQPSLDFYHPYEAVGDHGESLFDLYQRAGRAVQSLLRGAPGSYLVVSHGALLNMALYNVLGLSPYSAGARFRLGNLAHVHLTYEPDRRVWWCSGFWNPEPMMRPGA